MDILGDCQHRGPVEELVQLTKKESPTWAWSWVARVAKAKPSVTVKA